MVSGEGSTQVVFGEIYEDADNGETVEFTRLQKAEAYAADGLPFAFDSTACDSGVVLITFTAPIGETTVVTVNHADTSIIL